jgi:hypothetical protein
MAAMTIAIVAPASAVPAVQPVPGTFSFNAVSCTSANFCIAVGGDNYTLIINGQEGGALTFPESVYMNGITCPTAAACYAVGEFNPPTVNGGVIIPFVYGEAESPITVSGTLDLNAISCPSGSTSCVAVGSGYSPGPPGVFFGTVVSLQNGSPSGPVQISNGFSANGLTGVACTSSTSCEAVGSITSPSGGGVESITSGVPGSPVSAASVSTLSTITCPSATTCWAAGGDDLVPVTSGTPGTAVVVASASALDDVVCVTATQCDLAGHSNSGAGIVVPLNSGTVGATQTDLSQGFVYGLSCVAPGTCIGVGTEGSDPPIGVVITDAVQGAPATIKSVAFSGSHYTETVTVTGSNFGPWQPEASPPNPVSCVSGPPSYDYATGILAFSDTTGSWNAGAPGSCVGIVISSWATNKVVFSFGTGYVWPQLQNGDAYQVSIEGASFSGAASIAAVTPPSIKSVVVAGVGGSSPPTVTVTGANLGTRIPVSVGSPTCLGGDTSDVFNGTQLFFTDVTRGWTGGESGDCLGLSVVSWAAGQVVFTFGPYYSDVGALALGDTIEVGLLSATFNGLAATSPPPTIKTLAVSGTASAPVVTVTGTGFGTSPPQASPSTPIDCVAGDTSFTYPAGQFEFTDTTQNWTGGETGDCIGLIVSSWTNTQVVFSLGAFYPDVAAVTRGDAISVEIESTTKTGQAAV